MNRQNARPKWWTLYLVVIFLFGLFLLETRVHISQTGHTLLQVFIVLVIFIAIWLWYSANEQAILNEDLQRLSNNQRRRLESVYRAEEIGPRRTAADLRGQMRAVGQIVMAAVLWFISTIQHLFQH